MLLVYTHKVTPRLKYVFKHVITRILGVPEVNFSFILPLACFVVVAVYGYRVYKIFPKE